jgi:Beta protein
MFDHTHYVPILKGKEGEYLALKDLTIIAKDGLTPLIEIPSIPYDFENDRPAKTVREHLDKVVQKIENCWGIDRSLFLDFGLIPPSEVMPDGSQPLKFIFDGARSRNLRLIPVTGMDRISEYQDAIKETNQQDGFGICLRLVDEDFEDMRDLSNRLNSLLRFFRIAPSEVDLLVDLESVIGGHHGTLLLAARSVIGTLPLVRDWRTLTLAASAFPQDLTHLPSQTITPIPRTEWLTWRALAESGHRLLRIPTFGDYAIAHPVPNELDPRLIRMSAQLRYTIDGDWLVFKERNVIRHGYDQFNHICRTLVARPEFKGAGYSAGDTAISTCAAPGANPGNATTWRRIGTNHHLTFVVDQLASLP